MPDINKKTYISYKEDNDQIVNGYFNVISITDNCINFDTFNNIVTIPMNRVLKIKEAKK